MIGILLKLFGFAIGVVLLLYTAASAFRSARKLDRRIITFKAEQAALEKRGGPINPYAALASLYEDETEEADGSRLRPHGTQAGDISERRRRRTFGR